MSKNGLTMTIVFVAESANYGEGLGNISNIKKMTRGNASQYSYISRQAIRYNIVQQAEWDNTPVEDKSGVVQFAPSATIEDYPEIDLFGYMKTMAKDDNARGGASTRSAVARLSNANINRNILLNDMKQYVASMHTDSELYMSGFYVDDITAIREEAEKNGLTFVHYKEKNRWAEVKFVYKG